jgi:hypothetical protein
MTVIARIVSSASGTSVDAETLRTVFMFCAVGLTVSLLAASYGVDLSPGFLFLLLEDFVRNTSTFSI